MLWLCGKACCDFFFYPKLTVLLPLSHLSRQTLYSFLHHLFLSLQPNHSPNINVSVLWPSAALRRLFVPLAGIASDLASGPGRAASFPPGHPAVGVTVGGRPASGGTQNSHTRVFLPSQRSRAVIAGLTSDEWLFFLLLFFPLSLTATGWRQGQCASRCHGMCQLGLQWLIAGFAQTERPHTHKHAHML